ncbi:MAG: tRNA (adenosine(37)-N6)-dimethylallyltransferase MiaA, partial [Hyphomicrobiaceae bacterium]|nr:tRNA (adenosine(37)-N6)-dimethylallyltransferase MiaA [Hyphomicrobiaceae bacterium]
MARARECPSLIVNADSMQVYRDLRILSARPVPADEATVPHALYGHADGAEAYSTGRYIRDLEPVLQRASDEGRRPILVGGTGLYIRACLEGLSPVPDIPTAVRDRWRTLQQRAGTEAV